MQAGPRAPCSADHRLRPHVILCVRGVISPLLANIYLHYAFDLWANRWRQREATGDMIIVRYADDVRHFTGRWIPFTERRGLEETTLGPTAYPAVSGTMSSAYGGVRSGAEARRMERRGTGS